MSIKEKLDDLERRAASLSGPDASGIDWRKDRLTDAERSRIEELRGQCRRGEVYDLSILTVPELRELQHLRVLASPQLSDALALRARELKDGAEYDAIAKRAAIVHQEQSQ